MKYNKATKEILAEPKGIVVVEPGVVLLNLREELEKRGLLYPADSGEKSSAIGGNAATNTGEMNGIKYGNTRGYVPGLEA